MKLIKGKRIDTNEWIEGSICEIDGKTLIIPEDANGIYESAGNKLTAIAYEVDAETLCLYASSMLDANDNGIDVWENDVYKIEVDGEECVSVVEQGMGEFAFTIHPTEDMDAGLSCNLYTVSVLEYLGNIIDNPELVPNRD